MSADQWTTCPRCLKRHEALINDLQEQADAAYGKVTLEEWKEVDAKALRARLIGTPEEFRVDHALTVSADGAVSYRMAGRCTRCDLNVSLEADKQIEGVDL